MKSLKLLLFCLWSSVSVFSYTDLNVPNNFSIAKAYIEYLSGMIALSDHSYIKLDNFIY